MIVKKLDDVCDFISGLWTGKKPPYVKVGVIRNTNFQKNGKLNFTDIAQLDVEVKQFSTRQLRFGDIVLEKSGGGPKQPVGRVCVFEEQEGLFSLSNFTSAIRVRDVKELDYRYLHYFLQHLYIAGETEKIQTHSTGIRNLQLSLYKDFLIPLPPLSIQQKIVEKIDAIFAEIDKATAAAEANAKNAESLFQSYLRKIFTENQGWTITSLGNCFELYQPKTITTKDLIEDGQYEVYGANGVIGRYDKYNHEDSQLLVTCRGATCGAVNVSSPYSWINGNAMVVKPKTNNISLKFTEYFFRGAVDLSKAITGAAQPQITRQSLSPVSFSYPSKDIQLNIEKALDSISYEIEKSIKSYKDKSKNLSILKGSILKQAFNGELVKE